MTTTKKKTKKNRKLLRIMTGYDQHTKPPHRNPCDFAHSSQTKE